MTPRGGQTRCELIIKITRKNLLQLFHLKAGWFNTEK